MISQKNFKHANKSDLLIDHFPFKSKDYLSKIEQIDFASNCFPTVQIIETSFLKDVIADKLPLFLVERFSFSELKRRQEINEELINFGKKIRNIHYDYKKIYMQDHIESNRGKHIFDYIWMFK